MLDERTLHESARAVALEAASRIVADTDVEQYNSYTGYETQQKRDKVRTQTTVTMAQEFYRFIVHGDTQVS